MLYELLTTGSIKRPSLPIPKNKLLEYNDILTPELNIMLVADSVREAYNEYYWNSNSSTTYKKLLYRSIQGVVSPFIKVKGFLQSRLDGVNQSLASARFGGYCSTDTDCLAHYPMKMHHADGLKSIDITILLKNGDDTTAHDVNLWAMQEIAAAARLLLIVSNFHECGGIKSVFVPGTFSDSFQGSQYLQSIGSYTSAGYDLFANVLFSITDQQAAYARGDNNFSLVSVTDVHLKHCLDILNNVHRFL
jgi:hypothetical protein